MPHTLFEVSWEVCNKLGGIHRVLLGKAKTLVERFGDDYLVVGPWLLANRPSEESFEESPGFEGFTESCRRIGVPARVGRWRIPGSPRTILVESSGLFERRDELLAQLWESARVDSITGAWDYVEPVLFGHAAGLVIERWCQERLDSPSERVVAHFHDWKTGAGLLHLRQSMPAVGTVFTTHATVLGRALANTGRPPPAEMDARSPEDLARELSVLASHSLEKACAREADVFTTVSDVTAAEAERVHGRLPSPLLPNGIDVEVVDELAGGVTREAARGACAALAQRFVGEDCGDAALLMLSGRYEFHNKGIDLLLEAMALLERRRGRRVVLFLTVPAGNTGILRALVQRTALPPESITEPLGLSTHNLIDRDGDPIHKAAARLGLANARGSRVKVIQAPVYLDRGDGLLDLPYEAVMRAMDLTVFPSFYEPWGYTPEESLAVGVPTVTTDLAGFGRWALAEGIGPQDGVFVLGRKGVDDGAAAAALAELCEAFLAEGAAPERAEVCRRTAGRTSWTDLIAHHYRAYELALELSQKRAPAHPLPRRAHVALPVAPAPEGVRPRLFPFHVASSLPRTLRGLERLARNVWWTWDQEAAELFEELSPPGWDSCGHNPVLLLRVVFPEDLAARAKDGPWREKLQRTLSRFDAYLAESRREVALEGGASLSQRTPIAYFCAEFGLHESLRIYGGGLGILAGDHLKSASDLNLPLVGVGLFYRKGYLRQRLTAAGEQVSVDAENDPRNLPMELVRDARGEPLEVTVRLPSSSLVLHAWSVEVGRVRLYLLDSDVEANRPEDRGITQHLYGGDEETRLRQEIALGRGGVRLLSALGLRPAVWHINEGHAAFLAVERCGALVRDEGLSFDEARELVRSTTVFTTHTPVPAGHDRFGEDLMRRYFSDAPEWVGVTWERFLSLGQVEHDRSSFNMTYLALSFSGFQNGVSALHAEVSKDLLHPFWPRLLRSEVPVAAVTNGVHLPSWTHPDLAAALGVEGRPVAPADFSRRGGEVDLQALWAARRSARRRLLAKVRENLERGSVERGDSPLVLARILDGLKQEEALFVGFARRFAPYKRANLVFKDIARLRRLLQVEERPLRIFFAGKAHPNDQQGKELLRSIFETCRSDEFIGRIFFLEDYDVDLARALVQGVDVWLNNPIRTLEASGTSGMKAAANGVLNLSVADGWWVEGYDGQNGWNIGDGRVYADQGLQDELDSANLCRILAEEVLPLFFEREADGVPRRWLEKCRRTLATIPPVFNTDRMVAQYRDQAYFPMARRGRELQRDEARALKELALEHQRVRKAFAEVKIASARMADLADLKVGDHLQARVEVELPGLSPADVVVELVLGHTLGPADLRNPKIVALEPRGAGDGTATAFEGSVAIERSGGFAYGLRVRARGRGPLDAEVRDLVLWA